MQIQALEAPREAWRLQRLAPKPGGSPTFAVSEPRRGPFGQLGVPGPSCAWHRSLGVSDFRRFRATERA
eukprot:4572596-Alexandrium_andersonii.AAC.1